MMQKRSYLFKALYGATLMAAFGGGVFHEWTLMVASLSIFFLMSLGRYYKVSLASWVGKEGSTRAFYVKVAGIFSLFVVLPCILVMISALVFFHYYVNNWDHERVQTVLQESHEVALAYLEEQKKSTIQKIMSMATELREMIPQPPLPSQTISYPQVSFNKVALPFDVQMVFDVYHKNILSYLNFYTSLGTIKEAAVVYLYEESCRIPFPYFLTKPLACSHGFSSPLPAIIPFEIVERIHQHGFLIDPNEQGNGIFIMAPLFPEHNVYLMISRTVDEKILRKVKHTDKAMEDHTTFLEGQRQFARNFIVIFTVSTVLLLCIAVYVGLLFARGFMRPVNALIDAARDIQKGYVRTLRAHYRRAPRELLHLIETFNAMIYSLKEKERDLLVMNQQLQERTQFIEGILAGVSSGIIGIKPSGEIILSNERAQKLLRKRHLEGATLDTIASVFTPLFQETLAAPKTLHEATLNLYSLGRNLIFRVHMQVYSHAGEVVVTFDDITELVVAQKKTAWEHVARRVAHEVKNPLTPIMLSAQRLQRKYLRTPELIQDSEIFKDCIETILRQVVYITKLIDEFSRFARMPAPVFHPISLDQMISKSILLQRIAYPDIQFLCNLERVTLNADAQQLEQVMLNLLKNAIEAVLEKGPAHGGVITITLYSDGGDITLKIEDNGIGLPSEDITIGIPYVTTKEHGSGLGISIVQKILQDHHGTFVLQSGAGGEGACCIITFPARL